MIPIPGFPGYEIDEAGNVLSLVRHEPHFLKRKIDAHGYPQVALRANWYLLHRLVLLAFRGPCPEGQEGRHLDGNPLNWHLSNLEWATHTVNVRDQQRHGTNHNARKTHCKRGHPFDSTNTYRAPSTPSSRMCRACYASRAREATNE